MIKSITFKEEYTVEPWFGTINPHALTKTVKLSKNDRGYDRKKPDPQYSNYTYIPLFEKGLKIEFKPGLNIIIGDNGTGKSVLMDMVLKYLVKEQTYSVDVIDFDIQTPCKFLAMDFVNDRTVKSEDLNPESDDFMMHSMNFLEDRQSSNGENTKKVLNKIDPNNIEDNTIYMFDEPETGLSIIAQIDLRKMLLELSKNNQIIVITHSKFVAECVEQIYDFDKFEWIETTEYFENLLK